jgi:tRNA(Ile)-lysidine synthase
VTAAAQAWLAKPPRGAAWSKLLVGVQRRVLQLQLQRMKISPDFELIESLRLQPERAVSVNSQHSVVSDHCRRVTLLSAVGRGFNQAEKKLNLNRRSAVSFGGLDLKWNFAAGWHRSERESSTCEFFDADKVGAEIILRHWRPGDRFQPIGMEAPVKLQDWFTNQKIPALRRRELVVATTRRGNIFWIEGLRIGEQFKLTEHTNKTLVWRW